MPSNVRICEGEPQTASYLPSVLFSSVSNSQFSMTFIWIFLPQEISLISIIQASLLASVSNQMLSSACYLCAVHYLLVLLNTFGRVRRVCFRLSLEELIRISGHEKHPSLLSRGLCRVTQLPRSPPGPSIRLLPPVNTTYTHRAQEMCIKCISWYLIPLCEKMYFTVISEFCSFWEVICKPLEIRQNYILIA